KAEGLFHKYGVWVVFVGRFLPGLRTPIFFLAGLLKFSPWRFIAMNGFAAMISAPLFVWLGHFAWEKYADDIDTIQKTVGRTKLYFSLFLVVIGIGILLWIRARRKDKTAA